jgi:hypothetical protein
MILRLFYNGAFLIASKNDLDDQNLLLATVHIGTIPRQIRLCGAHEPFHSPVGNNRVYGCHIILFDEE